MNLKLLYRRLKFLLRLYWLYLLKYIVNIYERLKIYCNRKIYRT